MLHIKLFNAATGEKIYDHLYQSLEESGFGFHDVRQLMTDIAHEHGLESDMIASEVVSK